MDPWATWLLERRDGGNAAYAALLQQQIDAIRDRLLDGAALAPGMTLLDVGCGDGLVGFEAIRRLGDAVHVIFSDISGDLLARARERAELLAVSEQCTFLETSATELGLLADASIDVVTSRAVLAYVEDKDRAFAEFARVLRPGGRISLAEPIFQDQAVLLASVANTLRAGRLGENARAISLLHRWRSRQLPDSFEALQANPITRFNERDLVRGAQRAGFPEVHLRLHVDVQPTFPIPWDALLASAPIPGTPTLAEILASDFSPEEREEFERSFRPGYESGSASEHTAVAYLTAVRSSRR